MAFSWRVELDSVDISEKVITFSIRESLNSYTREVILDFADPEIYTQFTWGQIPTTPKIEVFTNDGTGEVSQGKFFIERPYKADNPTAIIQRGVWGRSETAKLGAPFAEKITKQWDEKTTFKAVIQEVIEFAGLEYSSSHIEIDDYPIYAYTLVANQLYPIDILSKLMSYIGGIITTDREGHVCCLNDFFHPGSYDLELTNNEIISFDERVEFPEYGNRIKISAVSSLSNASIQLEALDGAECLPADGTAVGYLLAVVHDASGNPAQDDTPVTWSVKDTDSLTLESETTVTGPFTIINEKVKASDFKHVSTKFKPSEIVSIYAYSDTSKSLNFYTDFAEISDNEITLAYGLSFAYCDQLLLITYIVNGAAVNKITVGNITQDTVVTASVEGIKDEIDIYIGNPCACGSALNIRSNPSSICLGLNAHVLVWGEYLGEPAIGKQVVISDLTNSAYGTLSSNRKNLSIGVAITNEKANVRNLVSGISQVMTAVACAATPIPQVYRITDLGKTNNLYSSHNRKLIDLDTVLDEGEEVYIDYTGLGATVVALSGDNVGTAKIQVFMNDGTESGLIAQTDIFVKDCSGIGAGGLSEDDGFDDPEGFDSGDSGDGGGWDENGDAVENGEGSLENICGASYASVNRNVLSTDLDDAAKNVKRFFNSDNPNDECDELEYSNPGGCSCEDLIASEIQAFGTTQGYDGGSGLTIHELAILDGGPIGSPEYYEMYQEHMDAATSEGVADCEQARADICGDPCRFQPDHPDCQENEYQIMSSDYLEAETLQGEWSFGDDDLHEFTPEVQFDSNKLTYSKISCCNGCNGWYVLSSNWKQSQHYSPYGYTYEMLADAFTIQVYWQRTINTCNSLRKYFRYGYSRVDFYTISYKFQIWEFHRVTDPEIIDMLENNELPCYCVTGNGGY